MENIAMQRAMVLIEQQNYDRAEKELQLALADRPDNEEALVHLALCKYNQGLHKEALTIINKAITINPVNDYSLHILARIYLALDKRDSARLKIEEAIEINPHNAIYFGVLANIHFYNKDFKEAQKFAEEGLSVDPENLYCLNTRSAALAKLGDKDEAYKTIDTAFEQDPNNAFTHANHGYILLEKREYKKALDHFKEALKNDPTSEYAKGGMLEALKSKHFFYRLFLRYSFWIGNLKGKMQWAFVIGFYVLFRLVNYLADTNVTYQPILIPILIIMFLFAFSSWFISPLHDLFLFLNPYGKYSLSKREKTIARLVGILLTTGVLAFIINIFVKNDSLLGIAGFSLIMLIPVGSMYNGSSEKSHRILTIYTLVAALIGLSGIILSMFNGILFNIMTLLFIGAVFIYQWVANVVFIKVN